jgi:hypothetical protein
MEARSEIRQTSLELFTMETQIRTGNQQNTGHRRACGISLFSKITWEFSLFRQKSHHSSSGALNVMSQNLPIGAEESRDSLVLSYHV